MTAGEAVQVILSLAAILLCWPLAGLVMAVVDGLLKRMFK